MARSAVSWEDRAACRDDPHPEAWFPDGSDRASRERAMRICMACPVRSECLEDALRVERDDDVFGIRGQMTQKDRERLLGRRRQLAS